MKLLDCPRVKDALDLASEAHAKQTRWNGDPYITHPIRVAEKMYMENLQIIGLLHDVLEDTYVGPISLRARFGNYVADAVECITKKDGEPYWTFIARIAQGPIEAVQVKLADLEDNLADTQAAIGVTNPEYVNVTKSQEARMDKYRLSHLYLTEVLHRRCGVRESK